MSRSVSKVERGDCLRTLITQAATHPHGGENADTQNRQSKGDENDMPVSVLCKIIQCKNHAFDLMWRFGY